MLIPRNRLLALVALTVTPLAALAGIRPVLAGPAIGSIALLLAGAIVDAFLGWAATGRGLSFRFPEVLRLAKGREGNVEFVVGNVRPGRRLLRLGLAFPGEIGTPDEELDAVLAPGVERTLLSWPCIPRRRGNFLLARIYYREDTPLGLWAVRRSAAIHSELRVYPDLRAERRKAAAVFLTRAGLGSHAQRQVGRGRDFEKLRDYVAGDSIEDISWKATARRLRPVSKVFQVERTQEVYVIIDSSRLSARSAQVLAPRDTPGATIESGARSPDDDPTDENRHGSSAAALRRGAAATTTVLERYVSSALMLCLAAQRQGDLFGLATFAQGVRHFLRAKNGAAHFDVCREAIYALEPAAVSPDFDELRTFLRLRLRRRALLVFLTSLDDPLLAEGFTRAVETLARQHLVIVGTLRPAGVVPLFSDPDGGAGVATSADVYRRLGGHLQWQRLRERENLLRRSGVRVAMLDPDHMTEQLVTQYMNVKRRQIL